MQVAITRAEMLENNALWGGILERAKEQDRAFAQSRILNEAEVIRENAEWLLSILYEPSAQIGAGVNRRSVERWAKGAWGEIINWGDLGAVVEPLGDAWVVTLEEAAADAVYLQQYVERWLTAWGFTCKVVTVW